MVAGRLELPRLSWHWTLPGVRNFNLKSGLESAYLDGCAFGVVEAVATRSGNRVPPPAAIPFGGHLMAVVAPAVIATQSPRAVLQRAPAITLKG